MILMLKLDEDIVTLEFTAGENTDQSCRSENESALFNNINDVNSDTMEDIL